MKSPPSTVSNRDPQSPEIIYSNLLEKNRTLHLATVDNDGIPSASYVPFVRNKKGSFNIYTSRLSKHTRDLLQNPRASIMLIEDEQDTHQIFARTRVTFSCKAKVIEPTDKCYETILKTMEKRFGNIVETLRGLPNFVLFQLVPESGRFVVGFGQAFDLVGDELQLFVPIKSNST